MTLPRFEGAHRAHWKASNYLIFISYSINDDSSAGDTWWWQSYLSDQLGPLAFLIPKEQKRPKVLQVVDVPLIENHNCEVWHERAGITVQLYPEMMCAGKWWWDEDQNVFILN